MHVTIEYSDGHSETFGCDALLSAEIAGGGDFGTKYCYDNLPKYHQVAALHVMMVRCLNETCVKEATDGEGT